MKNIQEFDGFLNESDSNFDFGQAISSLENAKMNLEEAAFEIKNALSELKKFPYSASTYERLRGYILGNLEPLISSDHGWMTKSVNIDDIIEEVKEMQDEDYEEDEM